MHINDILARPDLPAIIAKFESWQIPEPMSGCYLWERACVVGYGVMKVAGVQYRAHRLAWVLNRGAIPDGLCVLHRCDNPCCCNPDHLFVGTAAENNQDKIRKDRHTRGTRHPAHVLDDDAVREIRASPLGDRRLSKIYGVRYTTIWKIRHDQKWRHVQ